MDAIWTALEGAKKARLKVLPDEDASFGLKNKVLDWLTM